METSKEIVTKERLVNVFRLIADSFYIKSGIQSAQTITEAFGRTAGGGIAAAVTLTVLIASFYGKKRDSKQGEEELLRYRQEQELLVSKMSKPQYVFKRFLQSFKPHLYGRQTIGLSIQFAGGSFLVAGISSGRVAETIMGVFIFIAGSILSYTFNDLKGWNRFGLFSLCTLTPISIPNAIEAGYRGDYNIAGATTCHMVANIIASKELIASLFKKAWYRLS